MPIDGLDIGRKGVFRAQDGGHGHGGGFPRHGTHRTRGQRRNHRQAVFEQGRRITVYQFDPDERRYYYAHRTHADGLHKVAHLKDVIGYVGTTGTRRRTRRICTWPCSNRHLSGGGGTKKAVDPGISRSNTCRPFAGPGFL
jgi:hypothetical protein